ARPIQVLDSAGVHVESWEEYAENYCWVATHYYACGASGTTLPSEHMRRKRMVTYYQWAPILSAGADVLPALPDLASIHELLWFQRAQNSPDGYDGNVVIPEVLSKHVRFMARYMEGCIYRQREHRRGVGCVLPLNMFLEKILRVSWWSGTSWSALSPSPALSAGSSVWPSPRRRVGFVRKYLKIMNALKETDKTTSRKFVEHYLRLDGVFILRLIAA
uniref:Glyco_hydro81C domain-containing protein n=1 Tax=Macrostomum lignano TaxID=282301 RepID=A0A1I8F498_9PLAT